MHTEYGNGGKNAQDPDAKPENIDHKCPESFPQPVDRTHQRRVGVKKRADPGKGDNEFSGSFTVKQKCPDKRSENQKKQAACKP